MPDASDDEGSTYAASAAGSESDAYEPETNTSRSQRAKPNTIRGHRAQSKAAATPARAAVVSASDTVAIPHPVTRHTLSSDDAEAIAISLLAWYAGVHAARGMPWRKPFNPGWTAEERGQRAYEVCVE
jgi:A/G-specific adenine glycosylase